MRRWPLPVAALVLLHVAGCSTGPRPGGYYQDDGPDGSAPVAVKAADATPRVEAHARSGNKPYIALGVSYTPLPSSRGYRERGIASWYGKKFHGRRTSSGEPYDMHGMSAAHKTLPLPTYVRVRNLDNGRTAVVRVNDRGPFLHNRLIDLSYAAADKLGIVGTGTGLVEVEAIDPQDGEPASPVAGAPAQSGAVEIGVVPGPATRPLVELIPAASAAPAPVATPAAGSPKLFLQVGAFKEWENASQLRTRLERAAFRPVFIQSVLTSESQRVYRVRVGPLATVGDSDRLVDRLSAHGVTSAIAVVE